VSFYNMKTKAYAPLLLLKRSRQRGVSLWIFSSNRNTMRVQCGSLQGRLMRQMLAKL
jgi:hypothetical protein